MRGWLFLSGAIGAEITGTILLDYSEGFQLPVQTTTALTLYALSFYLLTHALRSVALSIAYATWSGIGTVAVAAAGVLLHNEVVSWGKAAAIAAVIGGVVLINFANRQQQPPPGAHPAPEQAH
ncbi:DMT family transporter [Paenarthrobacter sp. 2TAF44]|uniref:DMT family transporter n=1 Tax=Paenarthrobacter sp. 2TAF44 TaxID=3233018 RepID=UPI003F9A8E2E